MNRSWTLLGLLLVAGSIGCSNMGRPKWLNPGSPNAQLERAERFDPHPQNDVGPSTVSTRPPGFEHEYAEVERARPQAQKSRFRQWIGM